MTPDRRQREEALDPSRSFIVEAPAGSGKTSLLVQRYLRLLSLAERPESVVAMTFTRKAAGELRDRVIEALRDPTGDEHSNEYERLASELARSVRAQDRKLGWNLQMDTSRLQIQTIDSLCAMLARQMPILSHFGGTPRVIENAGELYHLAARQTMRSLAEGTPGERELFHRVSLHFDNDLKRLEDQVARMLERREQWRAFRKTAHPQNVQDFCDILNHAEQSLRSVFQDAAEVDFSEITRAAIEALGTPEAPSDLLYWLDYRIEHLLVDEFQDTSLSQFDLLKALTEQWSDGDGRTLFVVGDPMQSIYHFREAEVSLFLQCVHEGQLGSVRLTPLRLTANFRSTPEIVAWTQRTFAPLMCEDDLTHGGVKLRPVEATRAPGGTVPELIPFVNDPGEEEAGEVVRLVKAAKPGTEIAILVRSRSHLLSILPALRNAEIRYEALEIDQLREQQHILDLISLTRAIVHVGDRLAWLACLRAPWCGLTLADLSALAEGERDRTIPDLLSDPDKTAALSVDGRARALRLQDILARAVETAGRIPLRDLVEQAWFALGGPAIVAERNHLEDAKTYFDLIEQFEQGGVIRDFSLLNQHLEFLFAKPAAGPHDVKVMTIHNAKGLEFDTVIIPKLGAGARRSDRDLLVWTERIEADGSSTLVVAAQPQKGAKDPDYEHVCDELDVEEQEELKRLFYVATTRAKNRLFLLGNAGTNANQTGCRKASSKTFLGLIWDDVAAEFDETLRHKSWQQGSLFAQSESRVNVLHRLPASWRTPLLSTSVVWKPELRRATASVRKITYEWVSDAGRHVGTLVHEMLKRIAREGVAAWTPERLASFTPLFSSELMLLGVGRPEVGEACAQVVRAVTNTLASERGRWVLHAHQDARSEWPVGGKVADTIISGAVDRLFRDTEGRLWIVDFKISEHQGGELTSFLAEQERRYSPQLNSYATLVSRIEPGPIRLGLYFPLLDAWREWPFGEEIGAPAHYTEGSG